MKIKVKNKNSIIFPTTIDSLTTVYQG